MFDDDRNHLLHILVQQVDDKGWVLVFAKAGKSANVGKQDGDKLTCNGERDGTRVVQVACHSLAHEHRHGTAEVIASALGRHIAVDDGNQQCQQPASSQIGGG